MHLESPASHSYFSQRLRLHYLRWDAYSEHSSGDRKPTILFVHGIHDHCRTWDDLARHFSEQLNYQVITPDLRGHGDSEWVRGSSYHYMDYVYDLHQLIEQAQLAPVLLVGHSLGGAIASFFAGIYPQMVEKLVLIEGIGLWSALQPPVPVDQRVREWVTATQQLSARQPRKYPQLSDAYQRMQKANPQLPAERALHLTVHGSNQNEDGSFSWKYDNYTHNFSASGMSGAEIEYLWQQISAPTLIVNAADGLEHRIGQDNTLQNFGDARLETVHGAGHWTYHDAPEAVRTLIETFLCEESR